MKILKSVFVIARVYNRPRGFNELISQYLRYRIFEVFVDEPLGCVNYGETTRNDLSS